MGELLRQGLQQLGAGIDTFAAARRASQAREDRLAQEDAKKEQERVLQERLGAASAQVEEITTQAQDPKFTRAQFAEASKPIIETAIQTQNPALLRALDPVQAIFDARERGERAELQATAEGLEAQAKKKEATAKTKRQQTQVRNQLNKDFRNDKTTQRTRTIGESAKRVSTLLKGTPSGPKDLGIIFNYMKLLDPGSVVRESEFRSAAGVRSFFSKFSSANEDGSATVTRDGASFTVPAFVVQAMQKLDPKKKGRFLLPEQAEAFGEAAQDLERAQLESQVPIDNNFIDLSTAAGVKPKLVLGRKSAEDRIREIDEARAKREAERAEARPEIETADGQNQSNLKAIDIDGVERLRQDPDNRAAFEALIQQENQERAARNLPPLTPEEQDERANAVLEGNGLRISGQ